MSINSFFPKLPMPKTANGVIGEAKHYGAGNVVRIASGVTKKEYLEYQEALCLEGYKLYAENEKGLGGTVFSATYTYAGWILTITYTAQTEKLYLSVCYDLPLSEYLIPKKECEESLLKVSLHMLELWAFGNSFVVQLKNGHFLIHDGGLVSDAPYLFDYLDGLTPEGEIPVVDGWLITHGHGDHCGVFGSFFDHPEYRERVRVEGFYYNEPNEEVTQLDPGARITQTWVRGAAGVLKRVDGTHPKVYRPQTGQRYYFSGVIMDIVHAQEQLLREDYSGDYNDSSTWCMLTIENQKCLFTGDGEKGGMKMMMEHYTKEYLDVDVMTLMHHGFNTQDSFTDYCKVKTLLVTTQKHLPVRKVNENSYLKSKVKEYYSWGDGTKILTFPYEIGSYKSLPCKEWIYNKEQIRGGQPNVDRYPSAGKNKEIRYFRPIVDNGFVKHSELLMKTIGKKMEVVYQDDGIYIELNVDCTIGPAESYQIYFDKSVVWKITGSDEAGLYYGIGKFLHSAIWTERGFIAKETEGVVTPACSFRATYYSVHFYNWYHKAPIAELEDYLETMLLWGYNTIVCILPIVNFDDFEDPVYFELLEKTRGIYLAAKRLGLKVGTMVNPNQGLKTTPHEFDADKSCYEFRTGGNGRNVCPEIPGAFDYLRSLWLHIFEQYKDIQLDYVFTWPYDEGGCGCEKCSPWGANGFVKISHALFQDAKEYFPKAKMIMSTWYYDEYKTGPHDLGEFKGLYERLKTDMSYVDYILADSNDEFPRYPLEHEIVKPIINFPEISMWGLFSWGGRGANPLLKRFQRIWDGSKHILSGGMPYSEGMFEDLSKVQWIGYYWEPDKHYKDIMWEYISFEISDTVVDELIEMMELIEENHVRVQNEMEPLLEVAERADKLAELIDAKLNETAKNAWRWRILYIRAKIDNIIYKKHAAEYVGTEKALYELKKTREWYLRDSELAQELMQELCRYYHSVDLFEWNKWTFPPVKDGKVLK